MLFIDSESVKAQSDTKSDLIFKQWKASMHPGSMDSPEEKERMNKTGCAHCHTLEGYQEVIIDGKKSTASYENPTGLICETCHVPDNSLRVGRVENACYGCHSMIAENDEENFSWCSQWAIVTGEGPGDFKVTTYESGAHSDINKRCVGCHMVPSPSEKENELVGGHTFRGMTKGKTPRVLNANACMRCHDDMTLEFVEHSQQKIKNLLEELKALLPLMEKESRGEKVTVPKFPKDPTINDIQVKAIYNYYMVYKDGSLGVHNPVYTKMILEDSIKKLKFLKKE